MSKKILLLGANERACFSVARNLTRHGYQVDVANWGYHEIARSRFVNAFHSLPSLEKNIQAFYSAFADLISGNSYWIVLPVNDLAVEFLYRFKRELEKYSIIGGINEPGVIQYSQNKYALWKVCRELGIHVPETKLVESLQDFEDLKKSLSFPVIAKPVSSRKIIGNRIYSFTVRKFSGEEPLEDFIRERIESIPIMLQQVVDGFGIGFNFLAHQGKLVAWYMHERINEPGGGGESSYRKTIVEDKYGITEKSRLLIETIGWHGVGMIEYKVSERKAYVMELNGRFWGSIELGIFAGMELPYWQIKYNYEDQPFPPKEITVEKEVYARNLRNDLLSCVKERSAKRMIKWMGSLPKMLRKRECVEDSLFADFRFRISMWGSLFSKFISGRRQALKRKFISGPIGRHANYKDLNRILFICEGNICRSPFAEKYLKKIRPDINVASSGLQFQSSKMSPLKALRAAKERGVDLVSHYSSYINDLDLEKFDALFVMDKSNYQKLLKEYPKGAERVFFLDPGGPISDPFGGSENDFKVCYERISKVLDSNFIKG